MNQEGNGALSQRWTKKVAKSDILTMIMTESGDCIAKIAATDIEREAEIVDRIIELHNRDLGGPTELSKRAPEPGEIRAIMDMPQGSFCEITMPMRFTVWERSPRGGDEVRIEYKDKDGEGTAWVNGRIEAEFVSIRPGARSWLKEQVAATKRAAPGPEGPSPCPLPQGGEGAESEPLPPSASSASSAVNLSEGGGA